MMSVEDVVDILSVHLLGAIYDDENIVISTNHALSGRLESDEDPGNACP